MNCLIDGRRPLAYVMAPFLRSPRIDFEFEKLIADGVHPVGKRLLLVHLAGGPMAQHWRFKSYPHRQVPERLQANAAALLSFAQPVLLRGSFRALSA